MIARRLPGRRHGRELSGGTRQRRGPPHRLSDAVLPPVLRVWHGWHAPDTDTEGGRPGLDTYPASKSRADPVGGAERGLGLNREHGSSAGAGGGRGRSGVLAGPGLAGAGRYPRPLPAAAAAPPGVAVLRRGRAAGRRELADPVP